MDWLAYETDNALPGNLIAGEALTKGAAVAIKASDGKVYLASASTGYDDTRRPCVGFNFDTAASGDAVSVITHGRLEGTSGLGVGDQVYLSDTAGEVTATAPSDVGDHVQVVGRAITATQFIIDIETYAEVSA